MMVVMFSRFAGSTGYLSLFYAQNFRLIPSRTVPLSLGRFGFHIAINPATVLTAGILQLPGVLLLVLVNYMILS